jgi:hypothetical protein
MRRRKALLGRLGKWLTSNAMVGGVTVLLAVSIAIVSGCGSSNLSMADVTATHEYLRARYMLQQSYRSQLPSTKALLARYSAEITRACPGVLRNAPLSSTQGIAYSSNDPKIIREELVAEVEAGLEIAVLKSREPSLRTFLSEIRNLTWSNPRVAAIVREVADVESKFTRTVPDACRDMRAWAASNYRRRPTNLPEFSSIIPVPEKAKRELVAMGYDSRWPERDVLQLLKHYGGSDAPPTSDEVDRLEIDGASRDRQLIRDATGNVEAAIGLS